LAGGGAGLAQTFMGLGLIDEYHLLVHPVIIGNGKPLFKGITERIRLSLSGTKTLRPGVVLLSYQPDKS
jgi:dihydrofolate reductase